MTTQSSTTFPSTGAPGDVSEYLGWGHRLGFSSQQLASDRELVRYFCVPTLEEGRAILNRATEAQRRQRQTTFFHPAIAARSRLGQGRHDRGEAVLFAAAEVEPRDLQGIDLHLPVHVKAISVSEKVVRSGEDWDVSVRGDHWGIGDRQELYVAVNVQRLVLEAGATVSVHGNVLSFLCQQLEASAGARIRILGTPFSVDVKHGPHDGRPGAAGAAGEDGAAGVAPLLSRCILGERLAQPFSAARLAGGSGTPGAPGAPGGAGRNGGMAKAAEVTLRDVSGELTIFAQAGQGGDRKSTRLNSSHMPVSRMPSSA